MHLQIKFFTTNGHISKISVAFEGVALSRGYAFYILLDLFLLINISENIKKPISHQIVVEIGT